MVLPILALGAASFVISWLLTAGMIRLAPRIGFVDKPGHRKIHSNPKPLGGGVAIMLAIAVPMLLMLVVAHADTLRATVELVWRALVTHDPRLENPEWVFPLDPYWGGVAKQTPLAL